MATIGGWASLYNGGVGVTGGKNGTVKEYTDIELLFSDLKVSGNAVEIYVYNGPDATLTAGSYIFDQIHNKTIFMATGQTISRKELRMINSSNLIWRNFKRRGPYVQDNQIDYFTCNSCQGIVFEHIDMNGEGVYEASGSLAYPDGCIDINLSNYITISHCIFSNTQRAALFGYSDTESANEGLLKITVQYSLFLNNAGRQPKCRFGDIHLLNCVFTWDPEWTLHPGPLPSSSHMIGVDAQAQIYAENCVFSNGEVLRRDEDDEVTPVTSGLKFVGCEITNFTSSNLDGIRPENVLWDPNTVPGYLYERPLMTITETKAYVEEWAGATYHLLPAPTTYALTTQVNTVLGGTITEVSTGPYDGNYAAGDIAEVTVSLNQGYQFNGFVSDQVEGSEEFPYSFPFPPEPVTITALLGPITAPSGTSFRFVFPSGFYGPEIWDAYNGIKAMGGEFGASLKAVKIIADRLLAFDWDMLNVPFANKEDKLRSLIGPDLTVSGGGNGSRWNKEGLLETELPNNRPRFTFNPETGIYEGIDLERQGKNEYVNSWDLINTTYFGLTRATMVESGGFKNSSEKSYLMSEKDVDSGHYTITSAENRFPSSINEKITFTFFIKRGNRDFIQVGFANISTNEYKNYNLISGEATSGDAVNTKITKIGGGWYQIDIIGTSINTTTQHFGLIGMAPTADHPRIADYVGNSSNFYEVMGHHSEVADNITSYIKTTSAPVTRPADIIQSTGLINIASPYSLFEIRNGLGVLKYSDPGAGTVRTYVNGQFISEDAATPSADLLVNSQGSDKLRAVAYKSGVLTEQQRLDRSGVLL